MEREFHEGYLTLFFLTGRSSIRHYPANPRATPDHSVVYRGDKFPRRIRQPLATPSAANLSAPRP